jgi:hypothetical protein
MANVKISALPTATEATGVDVVPLVQSGVTKKLSMTALLTSPTLFGSGMSTFLATPSSANLRATLTDETGTGSAVFATTPTLTTPTVTGPTVSAGNLTFSSTAQRITGDFSNATVANRLMFQTSTTDGNTSVGAIPNGSSTTSAFAVFGSSSDPGNSSSGLLQMVGGSEMRVVSTITGTGTYLPMAFYTGGSERVRIDTSGNVNISTLGARITGDFTNATVSNRLTFQTSTANSTSSVGVIPSGTGTTANFAVVNNSNPTNASVGLLQATSSVIAITSAATGSGTVLPITFNIPGEVARIDTSGNVGIGRAPNYQLDVYRSGTTNSTVAAANDNVVNILQGVGNTAGVVGTITSHPLVFTAGNTERMRITLTGNIVAGASAALATTATDGFLYVPTCAGTPTGVPTSITGMVPIVVNTTNNKLYFYSGGAWRDAGP